MRFLLILNFFLCSPSFGEEFLGIESDESEDIEEPQKKSSKQKKKSKRAEPSDEGSSGGSWSFMLNGGSNGRGAVSAMVGVEYSTNKWTGIRLVGDYDRVETDDDAVGTSYGPTLFYILRIPNPTMVLPSAGAGPGYVRWKRTKDGEIFSDSGSATLNAFWGAALLFTKHFGLSIQRHWISYLGKSPKTYEDIEIDENRTYMRTSFGFFAYF
jgi:hypothetical protein